MSVEKSHRNGSPESLYGLLIDKCIEVGRLPRRDRRREKPNVQALADVAAASFKNLPIRDRSDVTTRVLEARNKALSSPFQEFRVLLRASRAMKRGYRKK